LKREIRQQYRNVSQDAKEKKSATMSYLGVEGDEFVVERDVAPTLMGQLYADVGVGRRAWNNCSLVLKKENFIIPRSRKRFPTKSLPEQIAESRSLLW
jgi:hypothetical protein